jgi:hypothetical protein
VAAGEQAPIAKAIATRRVRIAQIDFFMSILLCFRLS